MNKINKESGLPERPQGQAGFIALTATIIISLVLLIMAANESSSGWRARFNILGTEAKEQASNLAEGCAEQALASLLTDPSYTGDVTTTTSDGTCHVFPVQLNFPTTGLVTIKTQGIVRGSYANLDMAMDMHDLHFGTIPTAPTTGTIFVTTHVINDGSPAGTSQANNFTMNVSANPNSSFAGSEAGVAAVVQPGAYSVSETLILPNYTKSTTGDCSSSVIGGGIKFCTITYNDVSTTLTLLANVTNNDLGVKLPADFPLLIDGTLVTLGQTYPVSVGAHTASATTLSGYAASAWGYDCAGAGTINIGAGQNKTCIINFDDLPPPSPSCADTVVMLDRTSSMFGDNASYDNHPEWIADEKIAAKALVSLYNGVTPHPQISIGHFADIAYSASNAGNASAEIISGAGLGSSNAYYSNLPSLIDTALANITDTSGFLCTLLGTCKYSFTNLSAAISKSDIELNGSRHILNKKKVMIVVSDGGANVPGCTTGELTDGCSAAKNAATNASNAAKSTTGTGKSSDAIGTDIYTIHFGDPGPDGSDTNISGDNQDFLATLANNSANDHFSNIAASTGFLSPSNHSNDGGSTAEWINPTNAYASGGGSATDSTHSKQRYYNIGSPSFPSGSSVTGIEIKANASVTDAPANGSVTLLPTNTGNFSSWTQTGGSSKQNTVSDGNNSTYVSEGTTAQTFVLANAAIPAGSIINSVTLTVTAQESNGNASIQLMVENGSGSSANQILGTSQALTSTWATYSWIVPTKPDGSAWTLAEVNAWTTRFGVFKSSPGGTAQVSQVSVVVNYTTVSASVSPNLIPNAIGTYDQWSAAPNTNNATNRLNNVLTNDGDTTYIVETTQSDDQTYRVPNAGLPAGSIVTSVTLNVVARRESSNSSISLRVDHGNNLFDDGPSTSLTTSYATYQRVMTTDPFTGSAWTLSEVNNWTRRFGVDKASSGGINRVTQIYVVVNYAIPGAPTNTTLLSTNTGNFSSWTQTGGSSKQNAVSDSNNSTYVSQGIDAQTFVLGNAGIPAGATINSVTLNVTAQESNGNASIQLVSEDGSGSSSHQIQGIVQSLSGSWTNYSWIVPTKPDGTAWTATEVNAWTTRFGVFKSSPGGTAQVSQVGVTVAYTVPVTPSTSCKLGVELSWDDGSNGTWTSQKTVTLNNTLTNFTFGGSSDTWGHSWSTGDFSGNNFRLRVQGIDPDSNCNTNAVTNLDLIQAKVHYSVFSVDAVAENADGDNFYLSPTSSDMKDIFEDIGTKVCLASIIVTPPPPPTTASVNVITKVTNNNGGSKISSSFTISGSNNSSSVAPFNGSDTGTSIILIPGTYNFAESSEQGYTQSIGASCSSGSAGSIVAGENRTCVISNDDIPPPPPPPDLNFEPHSWEEIKTAE